MNFNKKNTTCAAAAVAMVMAYYRDSSRGHQGERAQIVLAPLTTSGSISGVCLPENLRIFGDGEPEIGAPEVRSGLFAAATLYAPRYFQTLALGSFISRRRSHLLFARCFV